MEKQLVSEEKIKKGINIYLGALLVLFLSYVYTSYLITYGNEKVFIHIIGAFVSLSFVSFMVYNRAKGFSLFFIIFYIIFLISSGEWNPEILKGQNQNINDFQILAIQMFAYLKIALIVPMFYGDYCISLDSQNNRILKNKNKNKNKN